MTVERVTRLFPFLAALLTVIAFAPTLLNDFVDWDDPANLILNQQYRGLGWEQLRWMWTNHTLGHYIPVTWMTFGLDYVIWGMSPAGYHLTSLMFHAANAVLVYFAALVLLRLAMPAFDARWIPLGAFFAALLFALHPLRVESVAWATARRDVVCGFFYLLAILAYLRMQERRRYYWLSLGCFGLALLSKEIAVTLPVTLLLLDVYPLRRIASRSAWVEKLPFLALSIADSAMTLHYGRLEGVAASLDVIGWFPRIAISVYDLAFYVWKTIMPWHLGAVLSADAASH